MSEAQAAEKENATVLFDIADDVFIAAVHRVALVASVPERRR